MIYKKFDQLNNKTLEVGDKVILGPYEYDVNSDFLNCKNDSNDIIFESFSLNANDFCRKLYGYAPTGGVWPQYKDLEAATRVCLALFAMIEGYDSDVLVGEEWVKVKARKISLPTLSLGKIGHYAADLYPKFLKVGCTMVSYSTVAKVYLKAKKLGYVD